MWPKSFDQIDSWWFWNRITSTQLIFGRRSPIILFFVEFDRNERGNHACNLQKGSPTNFEGNYKLIRSFENYSSYFQRSSKLRLSICRHQTRRTMPWSTLKYNTRFSCFVTFNVLHSHRFQLDISKPAPKMPSKSTWEILTKRKKNTNDHQASNLFDPQSNPSPEQGLPLKSTNVKRTETWKIPMVQVETCQPNETPAYMRQSLLNSPLAISKKKKKQSLLLTPQQYSRHERRPRGSWGT